MRLPWDSEFFGFEVARWDSPDSSRQALAHAAETRAEGIRLIYWLAPPSAEAQETARLLGATLVDRKVTYLSKVGPARSPHPSVHATTVRTDRLLSLALQSGEYSRFRIDQRLPPGSFERMYTLWLDRSLSGEMAREVLVFRRGAEELGFLTLGVKNGRLDIGLLAVDASARGMGVGAALVQTAFARAASWGFDELQVVTQQDNAGACRFYERCGFAQDRVEYVYHLWL